MADVIILAKSRPLPHRYCERSEAILSLTAEPVWIASSLTLFAMTTPVTSPSGPAC
jgi:hypothetical protein